MQCKICQDKHTIFKNGKWVRCECINLRRAERIMQEAKYPIPLLEVRAGDWKMTTQPLKTAGKLISDVITTNRKAPVVISSTSTKKDLAGAIIVKELLVRNSSIESVGIYNLKVLVENTFAKIVDDNDWHRNAIITLSIGDENPNSAHIAEFYSILYHSLVNKKLLLVLSSKRKDSLRSLYKEQIYDLLKDNALFIEC